MEELIIKKPNTDVPANETTAQKRPLVGHNDSFQIYSSGKESISQDAGQRQIPRYNCPCGGFPCRLTLSNEDVNKSVSKLMFLIHMPCDRHFHYPPFMIIVSIKESASSSEFL